MSPLRREHALLGVAALGLAGACVSVNDSPASEAASRDASDGEHVCAAGQHPGLGSRDCDATSGSGAPSEGECGSGGRQSCTVGECPHQANRLDEARGCWKKSETVGCTPAGSSCPPVILYMRDAQGARWSFPSGCPLPGFTRVDESEVAQLSSLQYCDPPMTAPPACDQLSVEACSDGARCKVAHAIQYDPARRCRWPGTVAVACVDFSQGCSTAVTHASYADQRMPSFAFSDRCIPPKYVVQTNAESVDDWPICPEAKR